MQEQKGGHLINGEWLIPSGEESIAVLNPATETEIGTVPSGTPDDVDQAVKAAKAAFAQWSTTPAEERAQLLEKAAEQITARAEEFGKIISAELGAPITGATRGHVGLAVRHLNAAAEALREMSDRHQLDNSLIIKEPIGVVGAITPWNFPLSQVVVKVAPALAAGCTVVLKPSELSPFAANAFGALLMELGLPPGAMNIVHGYGPIVGEAIASHPVIRMVSFTGSTRAGRRVAALAAETVKRVALELGGKSPNIILDDADFKEAVTAGVGACFGNSGQVCSALTRMIVPKSRLEEVEEIAVSAAETYTVGDPNDEATKLGPLVSQTQKERVLGYINKGIEEGAELLIGGPEPVEGLERGYYVRPTIFSNVRRDMTIAQEEIFGPVLVIMPYEDDADAVEIANDSIYGLTGAVWSSDLERAQRVAEQIQTGRVGVNGVVGSARVPFGGYKQSGIGREWGQYGIEEFLETKAIAIPGS